MAGLGRYAVIQSSQASAITNRIGGQLNFYFATKYRKANQARIMTSQNNKWPRGRTLVKCNASLVLAKSV